MNKYLVNLSAKFLELLSTVSAVSSNTDSRPGMSQIQQHKTGSAKQESTIVKQWEDSFLKSVLKTRFMKLSRANNLSQTIKDKTEVERTQMQKVRKKVTNFLDKARKDNLPYNEVFTTVRTHEDKIKAIRGAANDKTESERKEKTTVVKEARDLDRLTAQNIMSNPKIDALSNDQVAELLEVE